MSQRVSDTCTIGGAAKGWPKRTQLRRIRDPSPGPHLATFLEIREKIDRSLINSNTRVVDDLHASLPIRP